MEVASFFEKWMDDMVDAQNPSGAFTDVAPDVRLFVGSGNAAWADAGIIVPWTVYTCYGDTRIIKKHYVAMTKWINFMLVNSDGLLRPETGFGDWLSIGEDTPKDVLSTACFAYSTRLLSKMALAIGNIEDSEKYVKLFQDIKKAFCDAFVTKECIIKGNTQTGYVLALHMDLLPNEMRSLAAKHLVENIKSKNWHLSTGFVGVGYLLPVLTEAGYSDIASDNALAMFVCKIPLCTLGCNFSPSNISPFSYYT